MAITVHHLNDSRSQRILWLLEELGVDYDIVHHARDPETRYAPPALKAAHPLGKSPLVVDGDLTIAESGAIVDYLVRTHGHGALAPAPDGRDHEAYLEWLHYAEGSAMLPFMLKLYTGRLGDAAAPLHPRIDGEVANHLAYVDQALAGRDWLIGDTLTGADVQMSFVGEIARVFGALGDSPNVAAWIDRFQSRPAYRRALEKGGAYSFGPKG